MANVTRSPRLAATGVATLSGLILNFRETETNCFGSGNCEGLNMGENGQ